MRSSRNTEKNEQQNESPNMARSRLTRAPMRSAISLLALTTLWYANAVQAELASPRPVVEATTHMVSAANPHAAQAGLAVLRAGGSAADAAIAIQMVLGLVEPQASGIGGQPFHCEVANQIGHP